MSMLESPIPTLSDETGPVTPAASADSIDTNGNHSNKSIDTKHQNGGLLDENDPSSPSSKSSKSKHKKKKKKSSRPERSEHTEHSERFERPDPSAMSVRSERFERPEPPSAISMRRSTSSDAALTSELIASPSSIAVARRHSPVIKTTDDFSHELSAGREAIVVPPSLRSSNSASKLPHLLARTGTLQRSKSDILADDSQNSTEYMTDPHPLRLDAWSEPPGVGFQVRGPRYLNDNVKINSGPSLFRLLTVDIVKVNGKPQMRGMCNHPNERIQRALERERTTGVPELPPFIFCINLVIPGKSLYHVVFYFGIDDVSLLTDTSTPFGAVASRFFFGDSDQFRDETFKLIPRIVEGNFIVRKAVGSKPAILGKKIAQTYIRSDRFMELIVDIASDTVASKIVTLSIGYAKTLAVDMAFVLEGTHRSMLPEQVLGVVRLKQIDFKKRDGQRILQDP